MSTDQLLVLWNIAAQYGNHNKQNHKNIFISIFRDTFQKYNTSRHSLAWGHVNNISEIQAQLSVAFPPPYSPLEISLFIWSINYADIMSTWLTTGVE